LSSFGGISGSSSKPKKPGLPTILPLTRIAIPACFKGLEPLEILKLSRMLPASLKVSSCVKCSPGKSSTPNFSPLTEIATSCSRPYSSISKPLNLSERGNS
jgi:hypothetical protein